MKFSSNKTLATSVIGGLLALGATNASAFDLTSACEANIFISGASAQDESLERQIRNLMVAPGGGTEGTPGGVVADFGGGEVVDHQDQFFGAQDDNFNIIIGELDPGKISGFGDTGTVACFHKRSAGGSAWGVQPVSQGTGTIGGVDDPDYSNGTGIVMMRGVDCTTVGGNTCDLTAAGGAQLIIPDVGLSDVEPAQFTTVNTPAPQFDGTEGFDNNSGLSDPSLSGMSAADLAALNIRQQSMFAFGTIINPEFYDALQVCQGLKGQFGDPADPAGTMDLDNLDTMPSLGKGQIVGMFTGRQQDLSEIPCELDPTDLPEDPNGVTITAPAVVNLLTVAQAAGVAPSQSGMEVCTRVDGSGTQAQFRIKVLGLGCNANTNVDFGLPVASQFSGPFGSGFNPFALTENSGSSDMDRCVGGQLETASPFNPRNAQEPRDVRWKIGFNATGKNSSLDTGASVLNGLPNDSDYYRFIKVDGQAPTLKNVHTGAYFDAVQATLQTRATTEYFDDVKGSGGVATPVIAELIANFGSVADIALANSEAVGSAATSGGAWFGGSLAIAGPGSNGCSLGASTVGGFSGDGYPCSLVTHSPAGAPLDNCRVPEIANPGAIDSDGS